jgi:hypothetical protein
MARSELVPIDQRREVVTAGERAPAIAGDVRALQDMTATGVSRFARRVVFLWFRVFVLEHKDGRKDQRVDVRIPISLPLVGMLFPRSIGWRQALSAIAAAREAREPSAALRDYLGSVMSFELVRVEEEKPGKRQLVVIGFD